MPDADEVAVLQRDALAGREEPEVVPRAVPAPGHVLQRVPGAVPRDARVRLAHGGVEVEGHLACARPPHDPFLPRALGAQVERRAVLQPAHQQEERPRAPRALRVRARVRLLDGLQQGAQAREGADLLGEREDALVVEVELGGGLAVALRSPRHDEARARQLVEVEPDGLPREAAEAPVGLGDAHVDVREAGLGAQGPQEREARGAREGGEALRERVALGVFVAQRAATRPRRLEGCGAEDPLPALMASPRHAAPPPKGGWKLRPLSAIPIVLAAAILAASPLVLPAADASHGDASCERTTPDYWTCTFACHAGDVLWVRARDTTSGGYGYPRVTASCGGVVLTCQAQYSCEAESATRAAVDAVGTCHAETVSTEGACGARADAERPGVEAAYRSPALVVPYVGSVPVVGFGAFLGLYVEETCRREAVPPESPPEPAPLCGEPGEPGTVAVPGAEVRGEPRLYAWAFAGDVHEDASLP